MSDSAATEEITELVLSRTRTVPDFPSAGIQFKDLSPLFADPDALGAVIGDVAGRYRGQVDLVCGIEARGFVIGTPVALALGVGFVPIRKAGKLPGPVLSETYDLEYGSATIEIIADALTGRRVLVTDDVLATGGTGAAAVRLLRRAGAQVIGFETILELDELGGRAVMGDVPVHTLASV
ncbi:adenine phosphoribosyltransferase [Dermacoccaceae bacterium W4C1]